MEEILVEARDVSRTYRNGDRSVQALVSATCRVRAGDRIALVGPSGSGKSTLLQILAGLDAPTTGSVDWPSLGSRGELRPGKVAVVFQTPSLLAPLTAVENVELPLLLLDMPSKKARVMALDALMRIDLGEVADKLPEELSGGQGQRVAMARAIATAPRLVLADEPTGQLDHPTAQHLFDVLLAALEGTGTALVVATHDQAIAGRMRTTWHIRYGVLETLPVLENVVSAADTEIGTGREAEQTGTPQGVVRK